MSLALVPQHGGVDKPKGTGFGGSWAVAFGERDPPSGVVDGCCALVARIPVVVLLPVKNLHLDTYTRIRISGRPHEYLAGCET